MPGYRVFKQSESLAISSSVELTCETDADALREAIDITHDCPAYELWSGARRVACVVNRASWTLPKVMSFKPRLPSDAAAS